MGLELYVGTLSRFYMHDWDVDIAQQSREKGGMPLRGVPNHLAEVTVKVFQWRAAVAESFAIQVGEPLDWSEDPEAPHYTAALGWAGWNALRLLAVLHSQGIRDWPAYAPETLVEHELVERATQELATAPFKQLLFPDFWLPVRHNVLFTTPTPFGQDAMVGSSDALLTELEALNEATLAQAPGIVPVPGPDSTGNVPFEPAARAAMGAFLSLVRPSLEHRLPMAIAGD